MVSCFIAHPDPGAPKSLPPVEGATYQRLIRCLMNMASAEGIMCLVRFWMKHQRAAKPLLVQQSGRLHTTCTSRALLLANHLSRGTTRHRTAMWSTELQARVMNLRLCVSRLKWIRSHYGTVSKLALWYAVDYFQGRTSVTFKNSQSLSQGMCSWGATGWLRAQDLDVSDKSIKKWGQW